MIEVVIEFVIEFEVEVEVSMQMVALAPESAGALDQASAVALSQ